MIIWLATVATPQFDGILHRLYQEKGLQFKVHYLHRGTRGRGWGQLSLGYPHDYEVGGGRLSRFARGARVGLERNLSAAVVFGYSDPFAIGLLLICRIRRLQVFTQSDSDFLQHSQKSRSRRAAKWLILRGLYSRRTRVWAIGPSNSAYWARHGLTNQLMIRFESPVPVPVDPPEATEATLRGRRTLFVGRISPEKGVRDAVAAVGRLHSQGHKVILRLVGQTPPGAELHAVVGDLGPWVDLVGPVAHDDLGVEYTGADVLVLPSLSEAYGLVVREALQFGLPVVATTGVPAARELCDRGWNLVPPNCPDRLADSIRRAMEGGRWIPQPPTDNLDTYFAELESYG